MTVNEIVNIIKEIALKQKPVKSVYDGNVYDNWNSAEVKYGSVNIGLQSIVYEGNFCTYSFIFYYGDRLLQDKSNANSIFSDGLLALQSTINILNGEDDIDIGETIVYTPYEQKFMDYLAGVYTTVDITCESTIGFCGIDDFGDTDDEENNEDEPDFPELPDFPDFPFNPHEPGIPINPH